MIMIKINHSEFKGVRPVTAKTGWREGNINRRKTWTPLSSLCMKNLDIIKNAI